MTGFCALGAIRSVRSPAGDALGSVDALVFSMLAMRADTEGVAWPSLELLAGDTKLARSTVHEAVKRLELAGWLRRGHRMRRDGVVARAYTLTPRPEEVRPSVRRSDRPPWESGSRTPVREPDPRPGAGPPSGSRTTPVREPDYPRPGAGPDLPRDLPSDPPKAHTPRAPVRDTPACTLAREAQPPPGRPAGPPARAPAGAEAVALLAKLREHAVFTPIARAEVAEQLAAPLLTGAVTLELALAGLDDLARDEGPSAAAAGPRDVASLAKAAARYIANARRMRSGPARAGAASSGPSTEGARALELWSAAYASGGRRYGPYTPAPSDAGVAAELAAHARSVAAPRAGAGGAAPTVEQLTEELLRHWMAEYLREDGDRNRLVEHRHPLAYLARGIPTYGTPWGRAARAAAPAPRAVEPGAHGEGPFVPPPPGALEAFGRFVGRPRAGGAR